jgi:DNA-binding response OmpR family regulator/nitrogen-specific signal transduction histidine kinase
MATGSERLGTAHKPLGGHGVGLPRPENACVLLVDGDAARRRLLANSLGNEGFSVLMAENGAQAYGVLCGQPVDVLILDGDLPQRSGEQTTERVKTDEHLRDTLVIVLGDASDDQRRLQVLRAGAEDYLPRNTDGAEVALRLRNWLRMRASQRELQRRNVTLSQLLHEESQRAAYYEQFSRNLLDAAPAPVVVVDVHGTLVAVNQAWQDFMLSLGASPSEGAVGRAYRPELFVADVLAAQQLLDSVRTHAAGSADATLHEFACDKPTRRWLRARVLRFKDSLATYIMVAHEDVTQQHLTHGALTDTTEKLQESRAQMMHAQKLESIGRLVGGVAHDFNNMLTSIICFTRFVVDEMAKEDPRRADLVEALRAADSAARLTNQLLTFSRRRPVQPVVIDLNASLLSIGRVLRRTLGETIELVILPMEEPAYVLCDPGQFDQLIFNLAIYARDAMLPRGGTVSFKLSNATGEHGDQIELSVSDNGPGMTAEAVAGAFEPFSSTPASSAGGLSLATCAGIVQQAAGSITLQSEPACGAHFRILLPRVAGAQRADAQRPSAQALPGLSGTALVVEDQPAILRTMARALRAAGLHVLEANSGEDAVALLRGGERMPELLVTDMMLPGMSGVHLVEQLRNQSPELRVVFVSGYAGDEPNHGVRVDDKTAFLAKPFTGRQLVSRASTLLASGPVRE